MRQSKARELAVGALDGVAIVQGEGEQGEQEDSVGNDEAEGVMNFGQLEVRHMQGGAAANKQQIWKVVGSQRVHGGWRVKGGVGGCREGPACRGRGGRVRSIETRCRGRRCGEGRSLTGRSLAAWCLRS